MNIKRFISIFLVFVLSLGMNSVAIAEGNSEIPEGYTPIYTAEDLNNIRNNLSGKYILMNDIDLSVYENWEPIGTQETPFTGEINGNGNAVRNMTVDVETNEEDACIGLFGYAYEASFEKLNVLDCDIDAVYNGSSSRIYVGAVVGYTSASKKIDFLLSSGNINVSTCSDAYVGGIGGMLLGKVSKCKNLANITITYGKDCFDIRIGGIGGDIYSFMSECSNFGTIEINAHQEALSTVCVGGIAGYIYDATIVNSYNAGTIKSNYTTYAYLGGIAGYTGTIINCYNIGKTVVTNSEDIAYGISGYTIFWTYDSLEAGFPPEKFSELQNCYYLDFYDCATSYPDEELMVSVSAFSKENLNSQEFFDGFDFDNIWQMDEELGRPVLVNEPEIKDPEPPVEDPDTPTPEYCIILRIINWILSSIKSTFQFVFNALRVL